MDIQAPPGYFMKLVDGIQNRSIPVVHTSSNSDMISPVTYLVNLEQPDGTCQVVELTEEEARCLGLLASGISDNTNGTTNSIETTTNVTDSVEFTNINLIKQPALPLNKAVTHHKKPVNIRKTSVVDFCNGSDLKEKQTEMNFLSYSSTALKADSTSKVSPLTDEEAKTFDIFLNNTENSTTNIESIKTVTTNSMQAADNSLVKRPVKVSNKVVTHRKKVVCLKKNPSADVYSNSSQKQKHTEMNLLSYSPTVLQVNAASQVLQLTEGQAKALGILSNTMSANDTSNNISNNGVANTIEATENVAINPTDDSNMNSVNQFLKFSNKTHRKKTANVKKHTPVDTCSDKNLNEQQGDGNIPSYSLKNEKSQLVQLTEEEAKALGILSNGATNSIEVSENVIRNAIETINTKPVKYPPRFSNKPMEVVTIQKNPTVEVSSLKEKSTESIKPLGSCENPIEIIKDGELLHSTQNLSQDYLQQIAEALQFKAVESEKVEEETATDKSNVIYRVVYPEELDLNPKPKPLKRGRPKKRLYSNCSDEKPELFSEEPKPPKNMRTRSGRITRPPQHIKKDFKKIETSEVDNMETDLKTVEFEPLKTNQPPTIADTPIKINQLENHQRKRSIASQFRCPKCKKAYLGHTKMLKHLQKHPDHGPIPDHCKSKDGETWSYLINLCNKNPIGQKGFKFCKELVNFLHNVRVLAKMFFKRPTGLDKNLYFVDSTLSNVLGIESGNYVLNESELHTEVTMLSFLNSKCFKDVNLDSSENSSNPDVKLHNESFDLDAFVETCQTDTQEVLQREQLTFPENGHHNHNGVSNNDFNHRLDSNGNKNSKSSGTLEDSNFHENKLSFGTIQSSEENDFSLNCDITSVSTFNPELQKYNEHMIGDFTDTSINANCERKSLQLDINNSPLQVHGQNDHQKSMNTDLSLHSELLSDNSLLNSLPNLRTSVEELMLNNVDSTQVTNLLDNSTSSDEVMNVDQFVNERFKNLTESDLELPNTSLNLDLPSLDLFQFHTS